MHVESPEDWFEQLAEKLESSDIDTEERESELRLARQEIRSLVYRDEIAGQLYADWYRRVEPEGKRKYSIGDVTAFCFLAAASGIVGNASYDALKALTQLLLKARASRLESTVSPGKYEDLRRRLHDGKPSTLELKEGVALLIRRRYWILVKTGDPETKDPDAAT
jgi:hypothetical protein